MAAITLCAAAFAQEAPNPQLPRGSIQGPRPSGGAAEPIPQRRFTESQRNDGPGQRGREVPVAGWEGRDRPVRDGERQQRYEADRQRHEAERQRDAQVRQTRIEDGRDAERRRWEAERQREQDRRRWDNDRRDNHYDRNDRNRSGYGYGYQSNDYRPHRGPPSGYRFRDEDNRWLRDYYRDDVRRIDRGRRPVLRAGTALAPGYQGYVRPVPYDVYGRLPPPPPGYQLGYYEGYTVVYDPVTTVILSFVDLLD